MPDFLFHDTCPQHDVGEPTREAIAGCKRCQKLTALAELRALCPPGTTVYTILRSVSRSGMSRVITPLVLIDGEPRYLTHTVSLALGVKVVRGFNDGLKIQGGGMDMGFHLVNSLSYALHGMDPDGPAMHALTLAGRMGDARPGYTLTHRWL